MRRFTVSLPDDLYESLRRQAEKAVPPASLQQMVRHAVDSMLRGPEPTDTDVSAAPTEDERPEAKEPTDLLVFSVRDVIYGIPIELVETVAAGLTIHSVPSSSGTLIGVAPFRDALTEVHDGGTVLQHNPLPDEAPSLLAIPGTRGRLLITVSSVAGLTPAATTRWSPPPGSSPAWVSALAWNDDQVIAVIDPTGFNL